MRISIRKMNDFLMRIFIIQVFIIPKTYMWLKAINLLLIVVYYFYIYSRQLNKTLKIDHIFIIMYIFWNIFESFVGILKGYSDVVIRAGTVNVIWPICFLIISLSGIEEYELKEFTKLLVIITFILEVLDVVLITAGLLGNTRVIEFISSMNYMDAIVSTSRGGLMAFRVDHVDAYSFLAPFCMVIAMRKEFDDYLSKRFVRIVAALSFVIGVISGVGTVWLSLALCVAIYVKREKLSVNKYLILFGFAAIMVIYAVLSYLNQGNVYYIVEDIVDRFGENKSYSTLIRYEQIRAMFKLWIQNPIFGQGIGYPVQYYRGGFAYSGSANEMMYFINLYQTGIIGVVIYFSFYIRGIVRLYNNNQIKWFGIPFGIGLTCLLISNAVNPILANLSTLWIPFFPYMISHDVDHR